MKEPQKTMLTLGGRIWTRTKALVVEMIVSMKQSASDTVLRADARNRLCFISGRRFADVCFDIVRAEHNTYGIDTELCRMNDAYDLIVLGIDETDVLEALENQSEHAILSIMRCAHVR